MGGEGGEKERGEEGRGEERHTGHGEMWKRMKDGQNNSSNTILSSLKLWTQKHLCELNFIKHRNTFTEKLKLKSFQF